MPRSVSRAAELFSLHADIYMIYLVVVVVELFLKRFNMFAGGSGGLMLVMTTI